MFTLPDKRIEVLDRVDKTIIRILNIDIVSISSQLLLAELKYGQLITINVDMLIKAQKDEQFYNVIKKAEWVVCDSKVLFHASRYLGIRLKETIPGSSFFPLYYYYHKNDPDVKLFLLGAKEGVAKKAGEVINAKVGREMVVGNFSPSFCDELSDLESQHIVELINQSGATVLIVGLGAPKQEKWIAKFRPLLPGVKVFMGLGATIDFEAGNIKRAPQFFQDHSLEWFFRLLTEPRRLWQRYLIDDLPIFKYIRKQKKGTYKDPFLP